MRCIGVRASAAASRRITNFTGGFIVRLMYPRNVSGEKQKIRTG